MKNSNLVKFSLTLVCAAVLSACGSSGGSSNPEPTPVPDTKPEVKPAPQAKESFGHKFTQKRESNLDVGIENDTNRSSMSSKAVGAMTVALDPSLDTVVVATKEYNKSSNIAIYLEDFDFRGNMSNATGKHTLSHIHRAEEADKGHTNGLGDARVDGASRTKTDKQGTQSGEALVYQEGRQLFISTDETELSGQQVDLRDRTGSVAEVYGNKTFLTDAQGTSAQAQLSAPDHNLPNYAVNNVTLNNTPFLNRDTKGQYNQGGALHYVQYGRVTSKLDHLGLADFRNGIAIDGYETYVASYGKYGDKNTEDNYFYRSNVPLRTGMNVDSLKEHYGSAELKYNGHAVTYGLDHTYGKNSLVPNALGNDKKLISGTHVEATVNLDTKKVDGQLYDVWQVGQYGASSLEKNPLVSFNGDLNTANGAIVGTAQHDKKDGVLHANLFGDRYAEELGGAVKSVSSEPQESWGAVFGAAAVQPTRIAPPPTQIAPNRIAEATQAVNP